MTTLEEFRGTTHSPEMQDALKTKYIANIKTEISDPNVEAAPTDSKGFHDLGGGLLVKPAGESPRLTPEEAQARLENGVAQSNAATREDAAPPESPNSEKH